MSFITISFEILAEFILENGMNQIKLKNI